ncbi:alpha-galactosidase [Thermoanaerobacter wiegelii]|uniref:Alpha-galactosidase n=1 Tax=Thermoanaerobacter wiegelii Rt8.B1 TaxID=697303 RepID=G2MXP5_9THEO|nr:alpha-galactosidase [Thermoanaerobacter wiegelii]AEM79275.1 glycoside hydrolase clan GH-D [Thermoanaerobacter wiegelii Rt8.B1]
MAIYYDEKTKTFHLVAKDTSYVVYVSTYGRLFHVYFGKRIKDESTIHLSSEVEKVYVAVVEQRRNFSFEVMPQEYPAYGNTDFRSPAYQIQLENGSTISDLRYLSHKIYKGKPKLEGLPATYVENEDEADTLEIELYDKVANLKVNLIYTAFRDYDVITRSVRFENMGKEDIKLLRALSMNVDFSDDKFDMLQLSGAWARERHVIRRPLTLGVQSIESRRGASSHQQNPFIALLRKDADEWHGDVYGFSLVYSGNFLAQVEVDQYKMARVSMGINPFDFSWLLKPGETFQTPEVVMVYSDSGLNKMSNTYHKLYRNRLMRSKFKDKERPILINNWEATYFDFTEEKLKELAKEAKDLGIELFVLDDGWFGKRNSDNSSLGDWFVNKEKIPSGLDGLAKGINSLGLKFGLWMEPEMVSPDSDLYREHPDWCIHVPNRPRSESRNQLVLDLSRKDVQDYIIKVVSDILESANISYVKWDMNRNMTEIGSALLPPERQRETAHRYILGLYRILEEITTRFPDVLFESCAGGGGRFDPGMLYYMPQTWTSDDTDAIERLKIQYGTSIVYPLISMGSHISAVPNHQVNRITPLKIRAHVAMSANFGFELDLAKLSSEEKEEIKKYVEKYKEIRKLVQFGDFYRLLSPFEGNETAWLIVSEDKREFLLYYFRVLGGANEPIKRLYLKGIKPDFNYVLEDDNSVYCGDELMYAGIILPELKGDFQSIMMHFKEESIKDG